MHVTEKVFQKLCVSSRRLNVSGQIREGFKHIFELEIFACLERVYFPGLCVRQLITRLNMFAILIKSRNSQEVMVPKEFGSLLYIFTYGYIWWPH